MNLATTEFLQGLRKLCDDANCLLIFDEVQCGLGRTGTLWAHQQHDVTPDIMTLAKPLAAGLPIGAVLMTDRVAQVMQPGDHGSTFAGGPLICHVACTLFDIIQQPHFLEEVNHRSHYLKEQLEKHLMPHPRVKTLRHAGLLFGIQCEDSVSDVVGKALELGLIAITAGEGDVIRLAPPLNVGESELDECVAKLKAAFN